MSQSSNLEDRIRHRDLLPFMENSQTIDVCLSTLDSMEFGQELSHEPNNNYAIMQSAQQHQSSYYYPPEMIPTPDVSHLNENPCLEDLDSEYGFEVEVPMEEREKKLWFYDPLAKRVFVKADQPLTAIISYKPLKGNLFVRLMPIFTSLSDFRSPVNRCPNHKDSSKTPNPEHLVRYRGHEEADYVGVENGEKFKDRLAVRIPLRKARVGMTEATVTEEICFSFGCLNSCSGGINRRATALIITLENEYGEILGRKVMNYRACTSPKRDYETDYRKRAGPKDMPVPSAKRPMIVKTDSNVATRIKLEDEVSSQESVPPSPSGEANISICLPNNELALDVLKYVQNLLSGEVTRGQGINKKYFKAIMKQIDEVKGGN